jgi:formate transporter
MAGAAESGRDVAPLLGSRRISLKALLRAWALVYLGNIAGALATAALVFLAGQHDFNGGAVAKTALPSKF